MTTWTDNWSGLLDTGDPADGSVIDTALDNGKTVINGNIDNANIASSAGIGVEKLDTGAILHNVGAASKRGIRYGRKSVALTSGAADTTITYSSDAAEGAAAFASGTPYFVGIVESTGAGRSYAVTLTAQPSSTAATIRVEASDGSTTSETVYVHWFAIGVVS